MTEETSEYKLTLNIWYNGLETSSVQIARAIHKIQGVTTVLLLAKTEIEKRDFILKQFEYPDLTINQKCPILDKCVNKNTDKCIDCSSNTGRKNYIRKDD